MADLELSPSPQDIEASAEALQANEYPGRVLIQGINTLGNMALQVYALMGRSEGSRDRIFVQDQDWIRVVAPDKTQEEMQATENAALIYYPAMSHDEGVHVVSNGAQTDKILWPIVNDKHQSLMRAVRSAPTVDGVDLSLYEPDSPNNTPRITGVVNLNVEARDPFALAIVRQDPEVGVGVPVYSTYRTPESGLLQPGVGFGIQTYNGNGSPLPSFDQSPYPVALGEGVEDTAHAIWGLLNRENRVALVVKGIDLAPPPFGSDEVEFHIINTRDQSPQTESLQQTQP